MGYLVASKRFNVPRSTFCDYVWSNSEPTKAVKSKLGRKPTLPASLEEKLDDYVLIMERKYFGCTRNYVKRLAYQLAKQNNIPNQFSIVKEVAGKDWFKRFMQIHNQKLSLRALTGTSVARAKGFNRESVNKFFDLYEEAIEANNCPPSRIFNVDETGLTVVQNKLPKIIALKGLKAIPTLKKAASRRGRPKSSAALITGSPCKQHLEESINKGTKRKLLQNAQMSKKATKKIEKLEIRAALHQLMPVMLTNKLKIQHVHIARGNSLTMYEVNSGFNVPSVKTGTTQIVREHTVINLCVIFVRN
ncbi:hypothetical protein ANN_09461 [Periplaneta americana]|uniref:HTH CENPB-type domain-containing protein n=1 Tax=Periplaneta americana TaxID=6978 RepID=A0ABQ8TPC4_PERAM|nr:hypothetical protein ANN_09461 [Periplaneta americana]